MSELTDRLNEAGQLHKGTDLGGLLQWAALHIEMQDEALQEREQEAQQAQQRARDAEAALTNLLPQFDALRAVLLAAAPIDPTETMGKDMAPHINLMGGHGDSDYLKPNGMTCRHVDLRETKPRKAKA